LIHQGDSHGASGANAQHCHGDKTAGDLVHQLKRRKSQRLLYAQFPFTLDQQRPYDEEQQKHDNQNSYKLYYGAEAVCHTHY
jgi:hypothetical protein